MRKFYEAYIVFFCCLIAFNSQAQLPVAPNGKFLKVNGINIYYEETGTGKPLLLLHGFGRTAEDWKPLVSALAKTNRVIAIDLPGHGRSDLMDSTNDYLHRKAANYIISFVESLKLDSPQIMGFSSGAIITLYMATLKPELAKKIIVIAGQLYFSDSTRKFISALGGPNNFIMDSKELNSLHGVKKAGLIATQFWNFRKLYGDPSFTPDMLATIKAKTLIVHGDDDPVAPVDNAFKMQKYIPGAHLWIIPYAEHIGIFSPENQQEFLRRTMDFLKRN